MPHLEEYRWTAAPLICRDTIIVGIFIIDQFDRRDQAPGYIRGYDAVTGTLQLPGWVGGANWNGAAYDPETQMLYVPSITAPIRIWLREAPDDSPFRYLQGPVSVWIDGPRGLPLVKPPWERITAIDLNTGEHAWMVPNGPGPRDHIALQDLALPWLGGQRTRSRRRTHRLRRAVTSTPRALRGSQGGFVMQRPMSGLSYTVAALAIAVGFGAAVHAQSPAGEAPGAAPRTSWGDPDLQGIWVGSTLTPLERPPQFEGRELLTTEEVAALEDAAAARNVQLAERPAEATTAGGNVDWREDGTPGFYNTFWLDGGTAWDPSLRTSLVVDPPDGRIPYTATARDNERPHGSGPWNSVLDLDTGERCLGDGLPQIWFGYNPNHQIFQTPEHVAIYHEMFHQRRIIPPLAQYLNGKSPTFLSCTLPDHVAFDRQTYPPPRSPQPNGTLYDPDAGNNRRGLARSHHRALDSANKQETTKSLYSARVILPGAWPSTHPPGSVIPLDDPSSEPQKRFLPASSTCAFRISAPSAASSSRISRP